MGDLLLRLEVSIACVLVLARGELQLLSFVLLYTADGAYSTQLYGSLLGSMSPLGSS